MSTEEQIKEQQRQQQQQAIDEYVKDNFWSGKGKSYATISNGVITLSHIKETLLKEPYNGFQAVKCARSIVGVCKSFHSTPSPVHCVTLSQLDSFYKCSAILVVNICDKHRLERLIKFIQKDNAFSFLADIKDTVPEYEIETEVDDPTVLNKVGIIDGIRVIFTSSSLYHSSSIARLKFIAPNLMSIGIHAILSSKTTPADS